MGVRASPPAAKIRKLTKGEALFSEGENSRAMYLLKSGIIRIFKKKGDAAIEIDTIRAGSVLGELAFLDGNPRSASGEALTACELIEISGETFTNTLSVMPEWLKILLKTVVGRLRSASTRIRQLEQSSTAVDYSDKEGRRNYVFLSSHDVLKVLSVLVLVASRYSKPHEKGQLIEQSTLERFGNQIAGLAQAKVTSVTDLMVQCGYALGEDVAGPGNTIIANLPMIEASMHYLADENIAEPTKRHDINLKTFLIFTLIMKYWDQFPATAGNEKKKINIVQIIQAEATAGNKEPFRLDDFDQMTKLGYLSAPAIIDPTQTIVEAHCEQFPRAYQLQRLIKMIDALNEQKRKQQK